MKPRIRVGLRSKITHIDSSQINGFSAAVLLYWVGFLNEHYHRRDIYKIDPLKYSIPIINPVTGIPSYIKPL